MFLIRRYTKISKSTCKKPASSFLNCLFVHFYYVVYITFISPTQLSTLNIIVVLDIFLPANQLPSVCTDTPETSLTLFLFFLFIITSLPLAFINFSVSTRIHYMISVHGHSATSIIFLRCRPDHITSYIKNI